MEVISIDGVEYVKASNIAKRFKYTADYVGQLCRGRKVDAKLIGRTWYVNPLSLTSHKSLRYAKDSLDDKTQNDTYNISISRQEVNPVLNKNTVKSLVQNQEALHYAKRIGWKPITYKDDDTDLLPPLGQEMKKSTKLNVDIAEAGKLEIEDQSKELTSLESEPLPQFPLSGNLTVNSVDSYFEENENNQENIDISEDYQDENNLNVESEEHKNLSDEEAKSRAIIAPARVTINQGKNSFRSRVNNKPNFTPDRVLNSVKLAEATSFSSSTISTPFPWVKLLFLIIVFLAFGGALLCVDQVILSDTSGSVREFSFSLPLYLF